MDLGETAQRVSVLHSVFFVCFDYFAAFDKSSHVLGNDTLSHLWAQIVGTPVKGVWDSVKGFG